MPKPTAKRAMPARSNKGGATRGKARAAQVRAMKKPKKSKVIREGISGASVDEKGKVTKAGRKTFTYRSK